MSAVKKSPKDWPAMVKQPWPNHSLSSVSFGESILVVVVGVMASIEST